MLTHDGRQYTRCIEPIVTNLRSQSLSHEMKIITELALGVSSYLMSGFGRAKSNRAIFNALENATLDISSMVKFQQTYPRSNPPRVGEAWKSKLTSS
jgi:hypothetical protein